MARFNTELEVIDHLIEYFSHPDAKIARVEDEDGETCCYRTPDGDKCAVGCLATDEQYFNWLVSFEGSSATIRLLEMFKEEGTISENLVNQSFFMSLQNMHDTQCDSARQFVELLKDYREEFV